MAKWRVYYRTSAETHVDVEANTKEEAWEEAEKKFESPQVCWHCSRHVDIGDWEPSEEEWGTINLDEDKDG